MNEHDYDGLADLSKVIHLGLLLWAWLATMAVVGYYGWRLWERTWDYIARFDWARMP